ncbi:MAG: hypothetical protein K8U57_13650 [Planctomycetes bacterium]|nr:hypothetical protein [Planctomycetota bacterium]
MIGAGLFGMVDQVPGVCHVATRFVCLGIPILPLDSWAVVERKELVSAGFLIQTVTGLPTTSDGSVNGVRVPFSWKSVLMTYIRTLLWPIHGIASALLVIFGLGFFLDKEPQPVWWNSTMAWAFALSAGGGFLLWQSYRRTRATPERAAELRALLGIV